MWCFSGRDFGGRDVQKIGDKCILRGALCIVRVAQTYVMEGQRFL